MIDTTKQRSEAIQAVAQRIISESNQEFSRKAIRLMAKRMEIEASCDYSTAKKNLAKAIKILQGGTLSPRGGKRENAGRPSSESIAAMGYIDEISIYTLSDKTGVRYVGQTNNPALRLSHHKSRAIAGTDTTPRGNWIREVGRNEITMTVIEKCNPNEANQRERYWIELYHAQGCKLVNGVKQDVVKS